MPGNQPEMQGVAQGKKYEEQGIQQTHSPGCEKAG